MNKRKASKSLSMIFNEDIGQNELISFTDQPVFQVEKRTIKKLTEHDRIQSEYDKSLFDSVIPDEIFLQNEDCKRTDSVCEIFSSMIFSDQSPAIERNLPESKEGREDENSRIQGDQINRFENKIEELIFINKQILRQLNFILSGVQLHKNDV